MRTILLAFLLLLSSTLLAAPLPGGTYTVSNASQLNAKITQIETFGNTGAVYLRLNPGYYGAISMTDISAIFNRVVIMSANNNPNSVAFSRITLTNCRGITFYAIGVANTSSSQPAVELNDGSYYAFIGCSISTASNGFVLAGDYMRNILISKCSIVKPNWYTGGKAIDGTAGELVFLEVSQCSISGNFDRGITTGLIALSDILFNEITLSPTIPSTSCLWFWKVGYSLTITGNELTGYQGSNNPSHPNVLLAVPIPADVSASVLMTSNTVSSGNLGVSAQYLSTLRFYNNSVRSHTANAITVASANYDQTALQNNIFMSGSVTCLWATFSNNSDFQSERNMFRSTSTNTPLIWKSGYTYTISQWRSLYQKDLTSLIANPQFTSTTDLHIGGNSPAINQGLTIAEVTHDIDAGLRSGAYDIGADEYGVGKSLAVPSEPIIAVEKLSLNSYPNPSNGAFRVEGNYSEEATYQVIDLQGRVVKGGIVGNGAIDATTAAPGNYILQVMDADRIGTSRMTIQ